MVAVPMFEPSTDESDNAPLGQFVGVVACTLKLDTVTEKLVTSLNSAERGHTFLIDNQNTVLWAPDSSLFGENLMDEAAGFPAFQQIVVLFNQRTPQNPTKIELCSDIFVEPAPVSLSSYVPTFCPHCISMLGRANFCQIYNLLIVIKLHKLFLVEKDYQDNQDNGYIRCDNNGCWSRWKHLLWIPSGYTQSGCKLQAH